MLGKLKRGLILRHIEKQKRGVVIDWGVRKPGIISYLPLLSGIPEDIRVWTTNSIEIWPVNSVAIDEEFGYN